MVDDDGGSNLLAALAALVSQWGSPGTQAAMVREAGVALDPGGVRAVSVLGMGGVAMTPSALAKELGASRPTTSKVLARLVSAGLVDRVDHHDDGRSALVALSPAGRDAWRRLSAVGERHIARALSRWDPVDAARFTEMLAVFLHDLVALGRDDQPARPERIGAPREKEGTT